MEQTHGEYGHVKMKETVSLNLSQRSPESPEAGREARKALWTKWVPTDSYVTPS